MPTEKGALNWLTALLLKCYGLTLTKSEFRDWLGITYNIEAKNTPIICPCGDKFMPEKLRRSVKISWVVEVPQVEQRLLDVEKSYFVQLVFSSMGAQDRPQRAL